MIDVPKAEAPVDRVLEGEAMVDGVPVIPVALSAWRVTLGIELATPVCAQPRIDPIALPPVGPKVPRLG
jgi:hypothetical protein